MKLHLVTFGEGRTRKGLDFSENARALRTAVLQAGFDAATAYDASVYAGTAFARDNAELLKESRGNGYWVWKPLIIRKALDRLPDGDVLIYSDAGKLPAADAVIRADVLARLALHMPEGMISGLQLSNRRHDRWTKRDCFVLMNADVPHIRRAPQIQVGWSAWTKTPEAFALLDLWQTFNQDRRVVSDDDNVLGQPNAKGFREHRHDQSIYTNGVLQMRLPYLRFDRAPALPLVQAARDDGTGNMRKFWGGERILRSLLEQFTQDEVQDPMSALISAVVERHTPPKT